MVAYLKDEGEQTVKAAKTLEDLQNARIGIPTGTLLSEIVHADLPATKGTIRLVTAQYPPFIQAVEGFYSGYEIEILAMFCRDRGYALEIEEANFDGILASVQSGKALKRHLSGRTDGVCSCRA